MKSMVLIPLLLATAGTLPAQTILAPATNLPIRMGKSIEAGRTTPGTRLDAKTSQAIPLPGNRSLPAGTELSGTVVVSAAAGRSTHQPAILTLRFDQIVFAGTPHPIATHALAAASFAAVAATRDLCSGPDDMVNPDQANWTTCQIGGDQVVRTDWVGPVIDSVTQTVGHADFRGVYTLPGPNGTPPKALGPFSTTSYGLYGYPPAETLTSRAGNITFTSPSKLVLHGNDVLLLQTAPAPTR